MATTPNPPVWMIHYECEGCSMSATCVANHPSSKAWHDHMRSHEVYTGYSSWTWAVIELPF